MVTKKEETVQSVELKEKMQNTEVVKNVRITKEQWLKNRELDISQYVYKKQNLDYISWAVMEYLLHRELEYVPDYEFTLYPNNVISCKFEGYLEYTLAITDFKNKPVTTPSSTDIENTKQRVFVKAAARSFGIAHKLYEGLEYVPDDVDYTRSDNTQTKTTVKDTVELVTNEQAEELRELKQNSSASLEEIKEYFKSIDAEYGFKYIPANKYNEVKQWFKDRPLPF